MNLNISSSIYLYIVGLLISLQTVITYDIRDSYACSSYSKDDLNITTYKSDGSSPLYYRFLLVDPDTSKLFVGSMNKVAILDLNNIAKADPVLLELSPDKDKLNYCTYQKPEVPDCQNHIRFITKTKDSSGNTEYFLCGTNALSPVGYNINWDGSSYTHSSIGSVACSDDPFSNLTALYVKNGNPDNKELMYYGTTSSNKEKSTVYRPIINDQGTVTDYMKGVFSNKWMKEAQFAGSFDVEDKVFFFFREISIENENIETVLYSRVGKFCKKDIGGDSLLRNKWTSFQKARLNCSIPGPFPTYFDVIQDVATIDGKTFFGLFTTNANGLPASAICAFDIDKINEVFDNGAFKAQANGDMSFWTKATNVPSPRPGQCTNDSLKIEDTVLGFIVDHPLMYDSVQQKYGKPLIVLPGVELQQLEMEEAPKTTPTDSNAYIFYAGSNRGQLFKILSEDKDTEYKSYLSGIYSPFDDTQVIWSLKQHDKFVYLGTDTAVTQVDVQAGCDRHQFVDSCVYDPHCVWDNRSGNCFHYLSADSGVLNFRNLNPQNALNKPTQYNFTKSEYFSLRMVLNNKNYCGYGKNIVWMKRDLESLGSFQKLKLDDEHFIDNKNCLVLTNMSITDSGEYKAIDADNENYEAASYNVQVFPETEMKQIYKAKFNEWCVYFNEGKLIQKQYTQTCGGGGGN